MHHRLLVAPGMMIVQIILHVKIEPASIHVSSETLVLQQLLVELQITSQYVHAQMDTLDRQQQIVDCVSVITYQSFQEVYTNIMTMKCPSLIRHVGILTYTTHRCMLIC